jgi:hypothetical protein
MLLLYKNAASMPDFILAMEEAQKKAKRAELPILDIELAMYAATSYSNLGITKKRPMSEKAVMPTRRRGPSGNRPTWLPMLEASTASVPGLRMNHSPERPTASCQRPQPM